eukprot:3753431-Rhodomonas_salina.1
MRRQGGVRAWSAGALSHPRPARRSCQRCQGKVACGPPWCSPRSAFLGAVFLRRFGAEISMSVSNHCWVSLSVRC